MTSQRVALVLLGLAAAGAPLAAQGHGHGHGQGQGRGHYKSSPDHALTVTREVLVRQGYEVIRIENAGTDQVVWYRRGNMGRGRGKGPPVKMIIRREADRVIFLNTPDALLVDIDVRLRL